MRSAFTGAFAPYICGLIEKKQALGYDYHGSACILRTFDEFCREQFPNETCLTAELAMKWAEQFKTEKNLSRLNRVSVIRELAKYMNSVGEQAYLLPLQLTKKSGRHIHSQVGIVLRADIDLTHYAGADLKAALTHFLNQLSRLLELFQFRELFIQLPHPRSSQTASFEREPPGSAPAGHSWR